MIVIRFLVLFLFAFGWGASYAQTTETRREPDNEGAVLYLSFAPELVYDDTTTFRGLSATPAPKDAIVTSEPFSEPQIAFVLAAFPPKARPEVRVVSFGIRYTSGIRIVRYGITRESLQMATRDWPLSTEGMMVGIFDQPDTAHVIEIGWLAIQADKPGTVDLVPHPDARMGARIVASAPPEQVAVAALGYLGFGQRGEAPEPREFSPPLAAACVRDSVCLDLSQAEADYYAPLYGELGGLLYLGQGIRCREAPCRPDPPVGACCMVDGRCEMLPARDCVTEGGRYQGGDTGCSPDPCKEEGTVDPQGEAGKP